MASSNKFEQTYLINFQTNISNVLTSLKQIQSEMKNQASNVSIFNKSSTDLIKLEQMVENFKSKLSSGISSSRDFSVMSDQISKINIQIQSVTSELTRMITNADSGLKFKNVDTTTKEIDNLKKSMETLSSTEKEVRANLEKTLKNLNISPDRAKLMASEVKTQEQLEAALDKELTKRREILELVQKTYTEGREKAAAVKLGSVGGKIVSVDNIRQRRGEGYGEYSKKQSAAAANEMVSAAIKQSVKDSLTLEQTQQKIEKLLKEEHFSLISYEDVLNRVAALWNTIENSVARTAKELSGAQANFNLLGGTYKVGESPTLSPVAQNAVSEFGDAQKTITEYEALKQKVRELELELVNLRNSKPLDTYITSLDQANTQTQRLVDTTQQELEQNQKLTEQQEKINQAFDNFGYRLKYIFSFTNAYQQLRQILRQTLSDVQSLDKAFGSIAMVTNMSIQDLWGSYSDYAEIAGRLGQTTQSAIEASSLFYQQGNSRSSLCKMRY